MTLINYDANNRIEILEDPKEIALCTYPYPLNNKNDDDDRDIFNSKNYITLLKHNFYFGDDNKTGFCAEFQRDDQQRIRILYGSHYNQYDTMKTTRRFYDALNHYSLTFHLLLDHGYTPYNVLFGHELSSNSNSQYIKNSIGLINNNNSGTSNTNEQSKSSQTITTTKTNAKCDNSD